MSKTQSNRNVPKVVTAAPQPNKATPTPASVTAPEEDGTLPAHRQRMKQFAEMIEAYDLKANDEHGVKRASLGAFLEIMGNQNESFTPFETLIESLVWDYVASQNENFEDLVRQRTNTFFHDVEQLRKEAMDFDLKYGIHKTEAA